MNVIESKIEKLQDPFGILTGDRYEIFLTLDLDEDDELFSENGVVLKLIYVIDENQSKIVQYDFTEKITDQYLDFALEEDEEIEIKQFCQQLVDRY
ncbi:DUF6509 family protein [Metabacillus litoralis]|uniref:DUF6509 family protein n=1 Tax=Metabacillus litoralis TaxID=152268 RepID=UPI001CFE4145|nr:DUF6509 family protein [Metabacillus litoralis]